MEMLKMLKTRRTIRKFTEQKVEREKLEKIAEAGLYAPNAGGGQGTKIIMIEDFDLIRKIGIFNANCENRNWNGRKVNDDITGIDDAFQIIHNRDTYFFSDHSNHSQITSYVITPLWSNAGNQFHILSFCCNLRD